MARSMSKPKSASKSGAAKAAASGAARRRAPRADEASLAAYAHDIRTALTGILALGELLASSNLGERERRWAAGIKGSAEHLAALTTLMIDAARADAGSLTLQRGNLPAAALIEALARFARGAGGNQGPRRRSDDRRRPAGTAGRRSGAAAGGAGKPHRQCGEVHRARRCRLEAARGAARRADASGSSFTVTDSGIGLNAAEIKRLFRPFAQANADIARRYGGAGLGLAVVKAPRQADGRRSDRHQHRTAAARVSASRPCSRSRRPMPRRQTRARGRRRRRRAASSILCAEDNPYGRVILNTILTELGHRADFVGSGEEAVAAVARGYDVVLMDVTLPGIDGLEATRRIRALAGAAAATPIIGISGRSEADDEQKAARRRHERLSAQAGEPERA